MENSLLGEMIVDATAESDILFSILCVLCVLWASVLGLSLRFYPPR